MNNLISETLKNQISTIFFVLEKKNVVFINKIIRMEKINKNISSVKKTFEKFSYISHIGILVVDSLASHCLSHSNTPLNKIC